MKTVALDKLLEGYSGRPADIIQALQDIQNAYGFISKENLRTAAENCGVSYAYAYSIATFYRSFSLNPRGRYVIKLCDGTACHLKQSGEILEELRKVLGIGPGQTRTVTFGQRDVSWLKLYLRQASGKKGIAEIEVWR